MRKVTVIFAAVFAVFLSSDALAQSTEFVLNPDRTGELTDAFPVYSHNGARGLSGPWDLDQDGLPEVLVAQHSAGGRVHVIENTGADTWELVYSTGFIDSTSLDWNTRYATAGDLDNDGNWEIIFIGGNDFNGSDPALVAGAYVFEHDGVAGSDNYGTRPATVGNYPSLDPSVTNVRAQNLEAVDVDGDGRHELLVPNDVFSSDDIMYVLSVNGTFETDGAGTGFETWVIESRIGPRENGSKFGGGSPYEIVSGDFNGDGNMDLSYHTWNNLNFFNSTVVQADSFAFADTAGTNIFYKASPADEVALFGGVAYDMDGDGNDEVFYANLFTNQVTVIDYDQGDDVLAIDATKVFYNAIDIGGSGGITVGDTDNDGNPEILVGGPGYGATSFQNGEPSEFLKIAEYVGGSPHESSSYVVHSIATGHPADSSGFHTVHRDSAGVLTTYYETALSKQGSTGSGNDPAFTSGIAYMGDSDADGFNEIVLSFQGVDDSLDVIDEVWNADSTRYDRTLRSRDIAPYRAFVRVVSMDGVRVSIDDERLVLPDDYVLEQNYPNPFNPTTNISFELPVDKRISVKVFDMSGRLVKSIVDNDLYTKGRHTVQWDGTNASGVTAASGTYVYQLTYGNFSKSRTMVLLK